MPCAGNPGQISHPQKSKPIILGHKWDGILVFNIVNGLVEN
jgi:hypothetical protein